MRNPYSLVFGKEPELLLSRYPDNMSIIDDFENENSNHVYMITGIRGSGKTVMMTSIAKHFDKQDDWFVVNLSPDMDLLQSLAAELGEIRELRKLFQIESLSVSLASISIQVKNTPPITDAKIALTRMLKIAKKNNKKILVTIDEVVNNNHVKIFTSVFQILLREELPIYLIMTGLYENIRALKDEKTLTFLYRAPSVAMKSINIGNIARSYKTTFNMDEESARSMAKMTKGYPFAFQVLGYLTWNNGGKYAEIIDEYKSYLYDYSYEKMWSELSEKDRIVAIGIAKSKTCRTEEVKEILNLSQNELNPYRKRLIDKGIVESLSRGAMSFTIPFFEDFVLDNEW